MLKTFAIGAVAAFLGSRLIKANQEGRLDGVKSRLQEGVDRARDRLSGGQAYAAPDRRPLPAPARASAQARLSPSDDISKPARAHPWPIDPRALPKEG